MEKKEIAFQKGEIDWQAMTSSAIDSEQNIEKYPELFEVSAGLGMKSVAKPSLEEYCPAEDILHHKVPNKPGIS
jgi:hypothetical protein